MEITRNDEDAINTKKFASAIFMIAVLALISAILIPWFLLGQNVYLESFIRLFPSSGDFLLLYYAVIIMDATYIVSNTLIMLDFLFAKLEFRTKLLIIYSNGLSVPSTLFFNALMIWLDMWSPGGPGIILILSLIGIYQLRLATYFPSLEVSQQT